MRPVSRALLVGAALLALPCLGSCKSQSGPQAPNVVVIVIDTLRADHLPFYGHAETTAPYLSELAAQGVVFEHAHSTSSWTAPATASIMTSLAPIQHGVLAGITAVQALQKVDPSVTLPRIPAACTTMAEAFQAAGYVTCGVADNPNIIPAMGFDQGFATFSGSDNEGCGAVNARVLAWDRTRDRSQPYFLYLHYMEPHRPYEKHAPWYHAQTNERDDSIAAYDSEISFLDRNLRDLARKLDWPRNTIIVVTADHGEEFLDHGDWDHGRTLYHEVTDVPLVVAYPDGGLQPRRVGGQASLLDVLPTVSDLAGLPRVAEAMGMSLAPAARGEAAIPPQRALFLDLRCPPWFDNLVWKAVIRGHDKVIVTEPDNVALYDLAADPAEQTSVLDAHPDVAHDLIAQLTAFERDCHRYAGETTRITLDAAAIEKLKSLGYVR